MTEVQKELSWRYALAACLTLCFQIWLRWGDCAGASACGISFGKAMIWAVLWPLYWLTYLTGRI
ncbi:MAG TPA: hypothetical protein VH934_09115 [Xanthobacteraceae bacterium]|jgi:hypothetical protein